MTTMKTKFLAVALLAAASVMQADDITDSRKLQQEAIAAYKEKKPAVFLEKIRAASDLRPQHSTLLMQLAVALAANDRHREALGVIDRVAAMGFVYAFDDAELQPVKALPEFARTARKFEANAKPIGSAKQELTIDRLGLIPEGMAWDARGKRWFISSVRTGEILAIGADGNVQTVADAPWGVFGMAVDAKRGVLWATSAAMPQVEDFRAEDKGKSALLRIELATGKVIETLRVADEVAHHFGDVAVAADGEVYVSDSASPVIFRVATTADGGTLEPFLRGPFQSMQGMAAARNTLYVADYSAGIFAIDLRTRDAHALRVPPNAALLGVDGLYFVNDRTLIGTQNGTSPNRIVRINLAPGGMAVSSVETLAANVVGMGDPTLGVVVGKRFFFNANAQWDQFGDDGKIADPLKLQPAVVLSVPVD
jgi:sugar lactone lactonase YvrE